MDLLKMPRLVRIEAEEEVRAERHRAAVEKEKQRIRERLAHPWWKKLFPFRITVTRT